MLTVGQKKILDKVVMFLNGDCKKSEQESQHRDRVNYLVAHLGENLFQQCVMEEIRRINTAGPKFMYKAPLNVNRFMLQMNEEYKKKFVHPVLYTMAERFPSDYFIAFCGGTVATELKEYTDKDFLDLRQNKNFVKEEKEEDEEEKFTDEECRLEDEEKEEDEDSDGPAPMDISSESISSEEYHSSDVDDEDYDAEEDFFEHRKLKKAKLN